MMSVSMVLLRRPNRRRCLVPSPNVRDDADLECVLSTWDSLSCTTDIEGVIRGPSSSIIHQRMENLLSRGHVP